MENRPRRKTRYIETLIAEAVILAFVFALLFFAEMWTSEKGMESKLKEKAECISDTFVSDYRNMQEVLRLFEDSMQTRVNSYAFLLDETGRHDVEYLDSLRAGDDGITELYITRNDETPYDSDTDYYISQLADGRRLVMGVRSDLTYDLYGSILNTSNNFTNGYGSRDLCFIVKKENERLIIWQDLDSEYLLHPISEIGIGIEDLDLSQCKWLKILGKKYYTFSYYEPDLDIITVCGVSFSSMAKNSVIAAFLLTAVIAVVMTFLVTFLYFSRQDRKRGREPNRAGAPGSVRRKVNVYAIIGLMFIALMAYYVQSLYSLTMHSIESESLKKSVIPDLRQTEGSTEDLNAIFDRICLDEARTVRKLLVEKPELRTEEGLARAADVFGLKYIMLICDDGEKVVSDPDIYGYDISDEPDFLSYEFNSLKYGNAYVICDPVRDELSGEYSQLIGLPVTDRSTGLDGILLICINPEGLQSALKQVSFDSVLTAAVSSTESELLAIDRDSRTVTYYSWDENMVGSYAADIGINETQLSGNYLGYVNIAGDRLFADSFEAANNYIYVLAGRSVLFGGRIAMTLVTVLMTVLGLFVHSLYFKSTDVADPEGEEKAVPAGIEEVPEAARDGAFSVIARLARAASDWKGSSAVGKACSAVQFLLMFYGLVLTVSHMFRDVLYTSDSIFGFIAGGRWNRGFNVFSLTQVLVFMLMYILAMGILGKMMDLTIAVSEPRTETYIRLMRSFFRYIVSIIVVFYSLSVFGIDSRSLLASAGIITLVIGLGAQDLITDIFAGLFIIFENEFQVGDIIEVNGFKGRVMEIGIRTTRLINTKEDVKSINNRNLTNIVNKTRKNSNCDVIISVGFTEDIYAIEKMLREELPKIKDMCPYIISGPTYGGVDDMSGKDMKLSIRTECLESRKFEVRSVVNREIKGLFDKYGFKLG